MCLDAAELLAEDGIGARVVSMPCWEFFEAQTPDYQDQVLPADIPVLSVEAASPFGWERWADDVIGIDRFGASAPGEVVLAELGFTARRRRRTGAGPARRAGRRALRRQTGLAGGEQKLNNRPIERGVPAAARIRLAG